MSNWKVDQDQFKKSDFIIKKFRLILDHKITYLFNKKNKKKGTLSKIEFKTTWLRSNLFT